MTIDAAGGLQGDVVDGGAGGVERLLLGTPDPGVVVDLAAGTITGPGEPDTLVGIRNVWQSGAADATLLGDDGDNQLIGNGTLDGRGGNDGLTSRGRPSHLTGGAGNDGLSVGPGDVADGGPGDDLILPTWFVPFAPSRRATVVCGAGLDRWDPPIGGTPMPTDCESSPIGGLLDGRAAGADDHRAGGRDQVGGQPDPRLRLRRLGAVADDAQADHAARTRP